MKLVYKKDSIGVYEKKDGLSYLNDFMVTTPAKDKSTPTTKGKSTSPIGMSTPNTMKSKSGGIETPSLSTGIKTSPIRTRHKTSPEDRPKSYRRDSIFRAYIKSSSHWNALCSIREILATPMKPPCDTTYSPSLKAISSVQKRLTYL